MEPSNHHREKFISMLKDSILTLCKNGLMDDHGIMRVEGLLGVTLQNHEVFLINIQEELLPLMDFSRRLNNGEHTEGRRTGLKTSPRMLTSVSEKRSLNHLTSRYPSNSKHSKITSPGQEDEATYTDDRGGGQRRRDSKAEEKSAVEESIQDSSNFDACGNRNSVAAYRERIGNELICLADGSGMEETSETETTSEPLELIRRTKDEPDDVIYNLSGSVMGQLQNLESGFNCTSLVNSNSVMHWSSKDPKNISLPSNLVPYLPSMLHHFPAQSVSHSSSLSPPSPNFASHGNMLHPFYTDSGARQSLGSNQRHSYKLLNRQNKKYCCDMCNYKSNRSYNLVRHVMHVHSSGRFPCPDCGLVLHNRMQLRGHQLQHHCNDVAGSVMDLVKLEPEESVNS